ncbi:MAG: SpoVA/SpoVAEb family sporulation membrane protein [Roseburia sp.]|nr:SpoVA/SpoVAEb family sporulation membrane protein [Anaeroplasma bactoclasticum]MCM1196832.1 SpoVA/SpoVAEb family sporulation membrane protein [Roseburia sp.]MCM1557435.1 SpoVA/SpoVAEb family sporulation membrane protein [Anaeroplasma bactoclasticum]
MIYFYAFLIGGAICGLAEIIKDIFKLTVGHMTVLFVCLGTLLDIGGFYDKLLDLAGAGAALPITNFGHSLVHAALEKANEVGYIGIFTGIYGKTSAGIAFTILISVLIALIFRPKK